MRPEASTTTGQTISRRLVLTAWCAHLGLSPFYLFESGKAQLADISMAVLVVLLLLGGQVSMPKRFIPAARAAMQFAAWVAIISAGWWISTGDPRFLIGIGFYGYNLVAFLIPAVLVWRYGHAFFHWTLFTVAFSVILQVGLSFFSQGHFERNGSDVAILYFNNSGQCAYYALLAGGMCLTCCTQFKLRTLKLIHQLQPLIYVGIALLCFFTASRAGSACALLLTIIAMWGRRLQQAIGYTLVAACLALVIVWTGMGEALTEKVLSRAESLQQSVVDELYYRGYDRIANHPEFWAMGAGERFVEDDPRIDSEWRGEIHSTLGSIFFSYGLVGFALFVAIFLQIARVSGFTSFLPMLPVMLFGLTANGIRHSEFWSLAAMIGCAGVIRLKAAATRAPHRKASGQQVTRLPGLTGGAA